ncbi:MAG: hypothetical protein JWQ28_3160, partial [Pedobacter sp.]|nr:hypothetical protein [Pedobacter sp.]
MILHAFFYIHLLFEQHIRIIDEIDLCLLWRQLQWRSETFKSNTGAC